MPYPNDSFVETNEVEFVSSGGMEDDFSFMAEQNQDTGCRGDATKQAPLFNNKSDMGDIEIIPSVEGGYFMDNIMHISDQPVDADVQGYVTQFSRDNDMNLESIGPIGQGSEQNPPKCLLESHWDNNLGFGDLGDLQGSLANASDNIMTLADTNSFPVGGHGMNTYNDGSSDLVMPPYNDTHGNNFSEDFSLPGENFMEAMVAAFNEEYGDDLIRQATHENANVDVTAAVLPDGHNSFLQNYENADMDVAAVVLPDNNRNFVQNYENADTGTFAAAMNPSYEPGLSDLTSLGFQQENGSFLTSNPLNSAEDNIPVTVVETHTKQSASWPDNVVDNNIISFSNNVVDKNIIDFSDNDAETKIIALADSVVKKDTISFGRFKKGPAVNTSVGNLVNCKPLDANSDPVRGSVVCAWNIIDSSSTYPVAASLVQVNPDSANIQLMKKPRKPRTIATVGFPTNVKSMLSTGIFDGVAVKYVSWSREKHLRGVIYGTTYICGCNDCNYSKRLTSYEFEKHAGCTSKHPNNHIYFYNGKTVYAVVQELRRTPLHMLINALRTVTGSIINEEKFQDWKANEFEKICRTIEASRARERYTIQFEMGS